MKACPDCAEEVQDAARVCRFCGHRFDGIEDDEPLEPQPGWPSGMYTRQSTGELTWWDGERWVPSGRPNDGLAMWGYITMVFVPLVGFIIGLVLSGRSDKRAPLVIWVSILMMFLGIVLTVDACGALFEGLGEDPRGEDSR